MKRSTRLVVLVVHLLLAPATTQAHEGHAAAVKTVDAGDSFRLDTPAYWVRHSWGVASPDGAAAVLIHPTTSAHVLDGLNEVHERVSTSRSTAPFSAPLQHAAQRTASLSPKRVKVAGVDAQVIELEMRVAGKTYDMSAVYIPAVNKGQALMLVALLKTDNASPELNAALDAVIGSVRAK